MVVRTALQAGAACYTVQSGDSLCKIAQQFYGACTEDNVNKIYFSNLTTIGPTKQKIYPGQKLIIP